MSRIGSIGQLGSSQLSILHHLQRATRGLAESSLRLATMKKIKLTVENLRVEAEDHYYNPVYRHLIDLGLHPHLLTDDVVASMIDLVSRYKDRVDRRVMLPTAAK